MASENRVPNPLMPYVRQSITDNVIPQFPPLVEGQVIQNGPYTITVTREMVEQRERENRELQRVWERYQEELRNNENSRQGSYDSLFQDSKVRRNFIKKVFMLLTLQLLYTCSIIVTILTVDKIQIFIKNHPGLTFLGTIIFLVCYCAISCSSAARRETPYNGVLLFLMTTGMAYTLGFITSLYNLTTILVAVITTTVIICSIALVATFSKFDLTKKFGSIWIITFVIVWTFVGLFIANTFYEMDYLPLILGITSASLMSMFLFFDIQTIMGGKYIEVLPEEVVFATTQLYVDIVLIYRFLLMIPGSYE